MAEEMMNKEMAPEEPMTGMAAPDSGMPMEEDSSEMKYDMETLVGNYADMEESDRKKLIALVASPVTRLVDSLLGEPVLQRFSMQIEKEIPAGELTPEGEGMMAPATEQPMADIPMEDEEATPPV